MLSIDIGNAEYYDSEKNVFHYLEGGVIDFEYSLKVMYEWEGKWKKPWLKTEDLTTEELLDFYRMMAITPIKEEVAHLIMKPKVIEQIRDYISDSNTATTFSSVESQNGNKTPGKGKIYTSEELYALMFMSGIPIEFENRNLSRLFVVLRVMDAYKTPPKKMSREDVLRQNAQLNAERKRLLKTKG